MWGLSFSFFSIVRWFFNVISNYFNRHASTRRINSFFCALFLDRLCSVANYSIFIIFFVGFMVILSRNNGLKRVNGTSSLSFVISRFLRSADRFFYGVTKCSNVCFIRGGNKRFRNSTCRNFRERRRTNGLSTKYGLKSKL